MSEPEERAQRERAPQRATSLQCSERVRDIYSSESESREARRECLPHCDRASASARMTKAFLISAVMLLSHKPRSLPRRGHHFSETDTPPPHPSLSTWPTPLLPRAARAVAPQKLRSAAPPWAWGRLAAASPARGRGTGGGEGEGGARREQTRRPGPALHTAAEGLSRGV